MTLTIHREEDEQRQLTLKVEVAETRVQQAMKETARKLSKDIRVPGFRQGRAPYHVILRRFGENAVRADAVEELVPVIFEEAIAEVAVAEEMYGQPSLVNMELSPMSLEFLVPLSPVVTLGDYRAIRKEIEPIEILDAAIDEELERIQNNHQKLETVERPSELGDVVTLSGKGVLTPLPVEDVEEEAVEGAEETAVADDDTADEGETVDSETTEADVEANDEDVADEDVADEDVADEDVADEDVADDYDDEEDYDEEDVEEAIFEETKRDFLLDSHKLFSGTPFVENLVGLSAGDDVEFSFSFPEDYEDETLAGREASFSLLVLEVKDREVPAIDDALAVLNGRYETLDELREGLHKDLHDRAQEQADNELVEAVVDDMLADATMIFPPAAVDLEISEMVNSFKQQVSSAGWDFQDFMRLQGQSEDDLRENFRANAGNRLKRRLVMRQLVVDEKITVDEEDVDAAIAKRVERFGDNEELKRGMREYFGQGQGFEMISGQILNDKVTERIRAIVTGAAPDLASLATTAADEDEEE